MADIGAAIIEIIWRAAGALVVGAVFFGFFFGLLAIVALFTRKDI